MNIKSVEAVRLVVPAREVPAGRRTGWAKEAEVANPMSKYPAVKRRRNMWMPKWGPVGCKVTAEDGTWGLGLTTYGRPVAAIVEDHFAPHLVGQSCFATERLWDTMVRMASPYGATGLASYAISAVDLALWDLKGKLLGQPVYELLGGPAHDDLFCYATGNDTDWHVELGFQATKLACPFGPADGTAGLDGNERLVAAARDLIGPDRDLMLDCWMAFDVEYTVRLAERLRPYRLKWIEDYLLPERLDGFGAVRSRLPWQTLATGEHWYLPEAFAFAAAHDLVDIFQPDIAWCGGITACQKIVHLAEAAGKQVILHGGGGTAYGQHFTYAMPSMPWAECYIGSDPGVPLDKAGRLPGTPVPEKGRVRPSDAPGFGMELQEEWLQPFAA
jgi:L-rhamnonate dehydratase